MDGFLYQVVLSLRILRFAIVSCIGIQKVVGNFVLILMDRGLIDFRRVRYGPTLTIIVGTRSSLLRITNIRGVVLSLCSSVPCHRAHQLHIGIASPHSDVRQSHALVSTPPAEEPPRLSDVDDSGSRDRCRHESRRDR